MSDRLMPLPGHLADLPDDVDVGELVSRLAVVVGGPVAEHAEYAAPDHLKNQADDLASVAFAALSELADLLNGAANA